MQKTNVLPKLLKARQLHSRIFAVAAIIVLFLSQPLLPEGSILRELMLWTGYVLVLAGAFGRVYCSAFIGGRKNETVVRTGPFSVVRNPLYVFSFLALIGIGLQSGMWLITALLVGAFVTYYPFVVDKEENFLRAKFGEDYERYLREVPRWLPKWKLWVEPENADCMPKFIRRTIGDALMFFLPMPAYALLAMLHAHHMIPVWLTLP